MTTNNRKYLKLSLAVTASAAAVFEAYILSKKVKYRPILPSEDEIIDISGNTSNNVIETNKSINILIWNSYKAKKKNFYKDLDTFLESHDLILLQEYNFNVDYLKVLDNLKDKEIVAAKSFYMKNNFPTGVCTISNIKHTKAKYIKSNCIEPILRTPKMALITEYNISNFSNNLIVINVHGINFVSKKKFLSHMNQIDEVLEEYKENPLILAGDFNSWSKYRNRILKEISLKRNLEESLFDNDNRRLKLDKVYTKKLDINNAKILSQISTSDHKPLTVNLSISKEQ